MATLYRANGTTEDIRPAGEHFSLTELQTLVGGYIEVVHTKTGLLMVLDEHGKIKKKPINPLATELYPYGSVDLIVGDVVVGTRLELDGPPDVDEQELTELVYAVPVAGESFRLYIYEADGLHRGGQWFRRVPRYLDEEITVEAAETLARKAIDAGKEVRVTDGGDMLVYHVKDHVRLYPAGTENVWATL